MILIGSEASGPLKMYSFAVYKIIWRRKGGFEPPPLPMGLVYLQFINSHELLNDGFGT